MYNFCKKCGLQIIPNAKICSYCGSDLSANNETKPVKEQVKEIIVSTGNIKRDYEVLRPIHLFHHSLLDESVFGEKRMSFDRTIDKIINQLKEAAIKENGDAILFLRVDFEQMQLGGTQYFVYGTLVKFK